MSKAIRSYPEEQRLQVAKRRVKVAAGGLGTISASAYLERVGVKAPEKIEEHDSDEQQEATVSQSGRGA